MHRNLDRRVEALVRVTDRSAQADLEALLDRSMSAGTTAFELQPDGSWTEPSDATETTGSEFPSGHLQDALLKSVVG